MAFSRNFFLSILILAAGCSIKDKSAETKFSIDEDEIYKVMSVVISGESLNRSNGLALQASDFHLLDSTLLSSLVFYNEHAPDSNGIEIFTITSNPYINLSTEDVDFMLKQKRSGRKYDWDNSEFNFDLSNKKNWYSFTVPLFSKDGQKAIVEINNLCPRLCGRGQIFFLEKKSGSWRSTAGEFWVY